MTHPSNEITLLLASMSAKDEEARAKLLPIVYKELHHLAKQCMRHERPDHTLEPTALVHEAYFRLVQIENFDWESRTHFFGIAAHLMRQVLVDHARAHLAVKRGGHVVKVSLDDELVYSIEKSAELLALDDALINLAAKDPRLSQVVELHFFGGLTFDQIAQILSVSRKTVQREWKLARAWLRVKIGA
jgi:RNA polymerase sigma factor (TIGR02999 family)